jgi:hypothetical protein
MARSRSQAFTADRCASTTPEALRLPPQVLGAVVLWRKRDKDAQALHADLVMLARLSQALSRARVVCLAA